MLIKAYCSTRKSNDKIGPKTFKRKSVQQKRNVNILQRKKA